MIEMAKPEYCSVALSSDFFTLNIFKTWRPYFCPVITGEHKFLKYVTNVTKIRLPLLWYYQLSKINIKNIRPSIFPNVNAYIVWPPPKKTQILKLYNFLCDTVIWLYDQVGCNAQTNKHTDKKENS